jgi:invasion protein IalB
MIARQIKICGPSIMIVIFACELALAQAGGVATTYVGPAIDRNIFREGEVRRLDARFQNWRVLCDEVPRLRQRFCSLFGEVRDRGGRAVAEIIVTTSEDGRPAAVLRLPYGTALRQGVQISPMQPTTQAQAKGKAPGAPSQDVKLVLVDCSGRGCMTLWPLSRSEIGALNAGGNLRVRFSTIQPAANLWSIERLEPFFVPVEAVIAGAGFADGVKASLVPGH